MPPSPSARISVTAPVSTALDWTGRVLFQPFDLEKWFVLGFCAWLAWIGQHGGGFGGNWRDPSGAFSRVEEWVQDHLALFVVLLVSAVAVGLVLAVLFIWLSSRGKLMFLDGVVHDRGAVVEPWQRFREQGDSLFALRIVIALIGLVVVGVLLGSMVSVLFALDFDVHDPSLATILVLSGFALVMLPVVVLMVLVGVAIDDLVVPIQWLRGCRALPAWNEALGLVSRHAGAFVLYALMKLLLALGIGLVSCCLVCVTCCVAALPYLGTVILLPFYVFGRSYSLHFLSQFDPEYAALAPRESEPLAATPS